MKIKRALIYTFLVLNNYIPMMSMQLTYNLTTSDNQKISLSDTILNQALRLKFFCHLFNNSHVKFTKKSYEIFVNALEHPIKINYDQDLNVIMTLSEQFGAYTLYAFCLRVYLEKIGLKEFELSYVMPALKKITNNESPDFLLNALIKNKKRSLNIYNKLFIITHQP